MASNQARFASGTRPAAARPFLLVAGHELRGVRWQPPRARTAAVPRRPGRAGRWPREAGRIGAITYEDDFTEARLMFQALPLGAKERAAAAGQAAALPARPGDRPAMPTALRREVRDLENDDVVRRGFESFRDALALFEPAELWSQPPRDHRRGAARCCDRPPSWSWRSILARGGDQQVALALAALTTMAPEVPEWRDRLDQVLRWTEEASSVEERGMRRASDAIDALESALGDWPAPGGGHAPRRHVPPSTAALLLRAAPAGRQTNPRAARSAT